MRQVHCQIKHDPDNGTYGDCMRACVASIMEFAPERVPHFMHDNCSPAEANRRMVDWLRHYGYAPFVISCGGEDTMADILSYMGDQNPTACYMLFGRTEYENHVVVCRGGEMVHDPAWLSSPLIYPNGYSKPEIGPPWQGAWAIMVIARS